MADDKDGFGATAQKLSRNPLGIIALFIVLVYAMAALVLGVTGDTLESSQRWPLIWFLVAFPVVVLAVFGWLVAKHHTKLYAPGDYPNEDGFFRALTPAEQRRKLERELSEVNEAAAALTEATVARNVPGREVVASRVLLAEGLVFRELELEFKQGIKRKVGIGGDLGFDGVIEKKGEFIAVEVKYLNRLSTVSIRRTVEALEAAKHRTPNLSRCIVAVVTDGLSEKQVDDLKARAAKVVSEFVVSIDFRFYDMEELERKFGVVP